MSNSGPPPWLTWATAIVVVALVVDVFFVWGKIRTLEERMAASEAKVTALEAWARDEMDPWVAQAHIWIRAAHDHIAWEDTDPPDPPQDPPPKFGD